MRQLPGFRDFEATQLDAILALKRAHLHAARDRTLIRAGEPVALATIFSGWALRHRLLPDGRRQVLDVLLPGDTVGLEALLGAVPRYSVQAATDLAYCVLDASAANEMVAALPWFRRRVLEIAAQQRQAADDWTTVIGSCDAEERTAFLLLELHERLVRRNMAADATFPLHLTQQQMADLIGLNVIHFHRVLRRLRSRGLITVLEHRVVLHDMAALRSLTPLLPSRQDAGPLL
jgi:CRP-like cAMP-binding protein